MSSCGISFRSDVTTSFDISPSHCSLPISFILSSYLTHTPQTLHTLCINSSLQVLTDKHSNAKSLIYDAPTPLLSSNTFISKQ